MVTNRMRVEEEETDSRRILYPTDLPMASPRSDATRQGLTLVYISAQRKHISWDTFGA